MKEFDLYRVTVYFDGRSGVNNETFLAIKTNEHTEDQLRIAVRKNFVNQDVGSILMTKIKTKGRKRYELVTEIRRFDRLFLFNQRSKHWVMRVFSEPTFDILNFAFPEEKQKVIVIDGGKNLLNTEYIQRCLNAPNAEFMFYNLKNEKEEIDIKSLVDTLKSSEDHNVSNYYFIFPAGYPLDILNKNMKYMFANGMGAAGLIFGNNTDGCDSFYKIKIYDSNFEFVKVDYHDE